MRTELGHFWLIERHGTVWTCLNSPARTLRSAQLELEDANHHRPIATKFFTSQKLNLKFRVIEQM